MGLWKKLFHHGKDPSRKKIHVNNAGVHLLFSGIMVAITIILIVYVVVFVHNPNKKYMNGKNTECTIIAAKQSCWRQKLLSASRIEEGRHTCWLFTVEYDGNFTKVQYMDIDDFPEESDGCSSAKRCGLEVWPCRVSVDDTKDVVLRWVYPFNTVIYCCLGIVCTLLFGGIAGWRFYKERNSDDETVENNSLPEEPVPFSFRTRLPTWMRKESSEIAMPAPAAMP